ncbi:hypothetical protein [Thermodesulfatator atlanticus]
MEFIILMIAIFIFAALKGFATEASVLLFFAFLALMVEINKKGQKRNWRIFSNNKIST